MKITLFGAAGGEVTGSAYYVETNGTGVLVDCGLFQGGKKADALNRVPVGQGRKLDAVVLTHGHLDHTGRLPLVTRRDLRVPVFATPATVEMAALILRDSARIQVGDIERKNRKRQRAGQKPLEPLYTPQHAEEVIQLFKPVPYQEPVTVAPGVKAVWREAGHMLGSASIRLEVEEGGRQKRVVFTGDLGPIGAPILRDFEPFHGADMVFLESTYGDHDHRPFTETVEEFVSIVKDCVEKRGKILVPTFAVGRAQLLMHLLAWMLRERKVPPFPVFLDSPMAIEATNIYLHHRELFDEDMAKFLAERPMREDLKTLTLSTTADDSRKINDVPGPCLIMAGAGMCNAGRIQHHLKQNVWKPDTHVIIVGYQSVDTLGRRLVDGDKFVRIHGDRIAVKAKVHTMGGFSAHAGQKDLLGWFSAIAPSKPRVILTHGENGPREELARQLQQRFQSASELPDLNAEIEL
jgi:metallo-beta-lactamase family protein